VKNIIRIFITIIFVFAATTFSQNDADKVLNDLQTKYDTIKDLSVEFTQSGNEKNKLAGMLILKKENKLRIDTRNLIIVTDGTTSWSYNKKQNKVIISKYDENDPGVFSINELVYKLPADSEIKLTIENGQNVLTLTPNSYEYSNYIFHFNRVLFLVLTTAPVIMFPTAFHFQSAPVLPYCRHSVRQFLLPQADQQYARLWNIQVLIFAEVKIPSLVDDER